MYQGADMLNLTPLYNSLSSYHLNCFLDCTKGEIFCLGHKIGFVKIKHNTVVVYTRNHRLYNHLNKFNVETILLEMVNN